MLWIWLIVCAFLAVVAEAIAGRHGLVLPVCGATLFYFTVVSSWRRALVPFLVAGVVLDLTLIRTTPATALLVLPITVLALFWRWHGDCRNVPAQVIPGAMVGLMSSCGLVLMESVPIEPWSVALARRSVGIIVQTTVAGAVLLPVLTRFLDRTAEKLDFPQYSAIQDNLLP